MAPPTPAAPGPGRLLRRWLAPWLAGLALACGAPPQGSAGLAPVADTPAVDTAGEAADGQRSADADAAVEPSDAPEIAGDLDAVAGTDGPDVTDAADGAADAQPTVTTIWVHHPAAAEVTLRGDQPPLSWATDAAPVTVAGTAARFEVPVAAGILRVKALRAGQWALGANHVVKPGEVRHLYPYFDVQGGGGRREDFTLPGPFGGARTLRAFLPPGYDENTTATYPLLLMHDGQNLFEDETASFGVSWQLDAAVLASLGAAKLAEVVVVGVDHPGAQRIFEYTPWPDEQVGDGGGGVQYAQWLQQTVLPDLAQRYRLLPGREHRVLGGSSLGALISLYALVAQPDTWGGAVCMSGAWWWAGQQIEPWLVANWSPTWPLRVWLDAGDVKDGLQDTLEVRDALQALGLLPPLDLGFFVAKGADHSEAAWKARAHLPLQFFFDPGDREPPF